MGSSMPIENTTSPTHEVRFGRFRSPVFLLAVLLALALAVLATGCGADGGGSGGSAAADAPDFGTPVSEMLEASEAVKSAHYVVDIRWMSKPTATCRTRC